MEKSIVIVRGSTFIIEACFVNMPVHLLSVVHALKKVIQKLNSLFANFFWREQEGIKK